MSARGTPRERLWTCEEIAYLHSRYGTEPARDIAIALGRSYSGVTLRARKEGLASRNAPRPWTEWEDKYLLANYEHVPTQEIARELGRFHGTVKRRADRLGLLSIKRKARAAVNHNYFSEITRPVQAYVAGLFASDGWVYADRNEIGINLNNKDTELVELVRDELAPLMSILAHGKSQVQFRVSSAQMKTDLGKLGVTPRKSLTLTWPGPLPDHLENSFILGCFDGDGCLGYQAYRRYYSWSLVCASRPFLEEVKARILARTGVKLHGPYGRNNGSRAMSLHYAGPHTHRIDDWLHEDVQGLKRKRIPRAA